MAVQRTLQKTNKIIIYFDLSSFLTGIIGVILGIISILALEPFWASDKISYDVTCVAIVFDVSSAGFAFCAFWMSYSFLHHKKSSLLVQNRKDYRAEIESSIFDFSSFVIGVFGTCFEIISLLALASYWNDAIFSYKITIVGVVCDNLSSLTALIALFITLKLYIKHKKEDNKYKIKKSAFKH